MFISLLWLSQLSFIPSVTEVLPPLNDPLFILNMCNICTRTSEMIHLDVGKWDGQHYSQWSHLSLTSRASGLKACSKCMTFYPFEWQNVQQPEA